MRRPIVITAQVELAASGDASLEEIKRAYEDMVPRLPFIAGATRPTQATSVFVTRIRVDHISEQLGEAA